MTTPIHDNLDALRPWLDARSVNRVLLITGSSRRFLDRVLAPLEGLDVRVYDGAVVHVPERVVTEARAAFDAHGPEAIVSLGGGSATGLGKALRLEVDAAFAAIPTTYSGSEMTNIYGVRRGDEKQTGREERVRPDLIIHDVELTRGMPRQLTITSLMNALAHPVSALSTGRFDDAARERALEAIDALTQALITLAGKPGQRHARQQALSGAAKAAAVLDAGTLGEHHKVAHFFGGRLGAEHAELHAAILPHSVAGLFARDSELATRVSEQTRVPDLPGLLFSLLRRVEAATSLAKLAESDDVRAALEALPGTELSTEARGWARDAALGRDPSARFTRLDLGLTLEASLIAPPRAPRRAVVALHGRGAAAESILAEARAITGDDPHTLLLAPQATHNSWYPGGYRDEGQAKEVRAALAAVDAAVQHASERVGRANVVLFGFSQGACLALEWLARTRAPIGGLVALSGARIGAAQSQPDVTLELEGMPVLLGASEHDPWVSFEDIERSAGQLRLAGASVTLLEAPGETHTIRPLERLAARPILTGHEGVASQWGFGNAHHSEALPGALPHDKNSPKHPPYGLWAEQINGTGFVAARHQNLRSWLYRARPSAQHTPFEPLPHPTLVGAFHRPAEPNLCGWAPPALPEADAAVDFVDGLITIGGAGSAALRRGWAAHFYAANRSMDGRAFYDADGDLLIIPQHGRIVVQTEFGVLDLSPGHVAVIPRGLRFSVLLPEGPSRGYVGEVFGQHFELPERGPVGANGLSDPRHFEAPGAQHEDRLHPGYRITARFGGELFEATQDHSPYDVVAWHGNYAPYRYDLMRFSPVGNTRFDHADPSIYTVLSAPMDELGSHTLDFVFFPPRWDPTEDTFRPPYFHRNATTEFNGIIQDPSLGPDSPFEPGCVFLTPSMTAHGVVARSIENFLAAPDEKTNQPSRVHDRSMWFQFESALPLQLSPWARRAENRRDDWSDIWGAYRAHFDPGDEPA